MAIPLIDNIRTELIGIEAIIDAVTVDRDTAIARADTATATVARLGEENAALLVSNQALLARLAALQPAPVKVDTWIGATINAKAGQTAAAALTAWEQTKGRCGVLRTFNSVLPTSFSSASGASQMHGRHRIISVKGAATAAYWDRFITSIPVEHDTAGNPIVTVLVIWHEPENDGGTMTPTVYRAACHLLEQRVRASGRDDVVAGAVLMSWLERDAETLNTSSADWFPTEHVGNFVLLLDPYDPNSNRTLRAQTEPTLALWRQAGGVWWGIAETASHRTGDDLARWITDGLDWAHVEGASFVCWFHSAVGTAAGPTGWWLDDPKGAAAWKAKAPVMR